MSGGRPLAMTLLLAVYGLLFLSVGVFVSLGHVGAQTSSGGSHSTTTAQFIGSRSCAQCHQREHAEWQSSQHAVAMQEANDKTVLGDFSGATVSHGGVTSTFYKKDGKFWVTTEGADGKPADFEIRYTFGVSPLQQYLIELPKGRLQALGIAWDTRSKDAGGQRWFALDPEHNRPPGDPLHWTGIDQNWNYQCAFCHATNLKKNYDPNADSFHTTWSELSVGCEACHGPASRHVAWASKPGDWQRSDDPKKGFAVGLDERKGVTWSMSPSGTAARSAVSQDRQGNRSVRCLPCPATAVLA